MNLTEKDVKIVKEVMWFEVYLSARGNQYIELL